MSLKEYMTIFSDSLLIQIPEKSSVHIIYMGVWYELFLYTGVEIQIYRKTHHQTNQNDITLYWRYRLPHEIQFDTSYTHPIAQCPTILQHHSQLYHMIPERIRTIRIMFSPKDSHNTILYIFIFPSFSLSVFSKA